MDDDLKAILALYRAPKEKPVEKWDHNGFLTLYPNGIDSSMPLPSSSQSTSTNIKPSIDLPQTQSNIDKIEKWDHAGYNLLYKKSRNLKKKAKKSSHKKRHKKLEKFF